MSCGGCDAQEPCQDCGNTENLDQKELGFFGNVWILQNHFKKAGNVLGGHQHYFDHVSLLAKGRALVEVEGYPAKEFIGPTFIVIKKEKHHKITSLDDDTVMFCIFAATDEDAGPDHIYSEKHSPYGNAPDGYWESQKLLEEKTVQYTDEPANAEKQL